MVINFSFDIYPFYKIIRPLNCILSGIALFVGVLIIDPDLFNKELTIILLGACCMIFVSAGGFVINDIFDIEIDKINKPERMLPSGRMSQKTAYFYTIFLFIIGVFLSIIALFIKTDLSIGIIPPVLTIIGIISLIAYAKYLKKYGIFGNLLITLLSLVPIIITGYVINDLNRAFFPVFLGFLLMYTREIIKDIEDIRADLAASSNSFFSLPAVIGLTPTVYLTRILLIFLIMSTFLPFTFHEFSFYASYSVGIFVILVDLLIIKILFELRETEDNLILKAKQAKKEMKYGIIFGLLAFTLNPFTPLS